MSLGAAPFQATPMQLINKRVFLVFSAKNVIVLLAVAQVLICSICLAVKHLIQLQCQWIKGKNERFLAHSHQRLATDHNMDQSEEEIFLCTLHTNWTEAKYKLSYKVVKAKVRSLFGHLGKTIFSVADSREIYLNEERLKSQKKNIISIEANFCHMRKKILLW